ncbi:MULTISPECIES: DNA polymerase III subunit epsilon [Methylosinus]|uniref:DNA polymerase III subunit epsilon n=1 Tax=Methylosinus trichosporium (strain ATCC 35070 / NCIMB 11131 / UNIQEM 75 / OB3b) TaxID=595536 RepID=A0A2D2D113_METT3|nr:MULTISPECIES: DNA polymerase III subunit epsilon [Methylosinus]ATQ68662.1 DNA polymerase III subunit epsilon [Methylosinus trichosporium OB3b]OBS53174.1 DNA polymerase III subunit epsilon [Methylosinus sp. 3S-1]
MREIVFDTETTGLDPAKGHRIVEIGAVEISNLIPTGRTFHFYLDPERDMPEEAFRVHGLSTAFLTGQKKFREIAEAFLEFVADAQLVAHNAEFDMRFVNAELAMLGLEAIAADRVVDTLTIARRLHPGAANSLDALCQRYGVDSSRRDKHGALLDSYLLAEVYAELMGGRQSALVLQTSVAAAAQDLGADLLRSRPAPLAPRLAEEEIAAHERFAATLGKAPIWSRYLTPEPEAEASRAVGA